VLKKFSKKVVFITGAGKGIGRALSESLLSKGAFVYALTRSKGSMKDIEKNKNIKIFYGDVSNIKLIKKILNTSIKEKKIINAVVNNAGIRQRKKFLKLSSSDINDVFKVNFFSIFCIMQLYCSYSLKQKIKTSIVNIGSIVGENGFAELVGYSATKGALKSLTKSVAVEHAKDNIRVNIVLPGFIKTSYFEKFKKNKKKLYKWTIDRTPISRWGEANEVVNLVEFLISDDSSYITGSSFNVDGGWLSS
jgi:NAD(P)-dependent dehydrogenase (short-subunit alcohol dehydrogenase family)